MRPDRYRWAGGEEAMLRFGPADGPSVMLAMPLLEEANRTRAFAVGLLRRLAERGIGGALPDLPGQGESPVATEAARLDDWREAFAAAAARLAVPVHVVAMRGGALVDTLATVRSRWHFAPAAGDALVRELLRTAAVASGGVDFDPLAAGKDEPPLLIAGNRLSPHLLRALHVAERMPDGPVRAVRLASDPAVADRKVEGTPLWRRSEPGDDAALAAVLAEDIASWAASCGG